MLELLVISALSIVVSIVLYYLAEARAKRIAGRANYLVNYIDDEIASLEYLKSLCPNASQKEKIQEAINRMRKIQTSVRRSLDDNQG